MSINFDKDMGTKYYKEINKYIPIKYYIGIDVGHEYTSVSCILDQNGECVSHMFRVRTGFLNDGDNSILVDWEIVGRNFCQVFKRVPSQLTLAEKEALKVFFNLIVNQILDEITALQYNPITGEANFKVCITYPDPWERMIFYFSNEYRQFLQEIVGLLPIECVSEVSAVNAFISENYNFFDSESQTHLILNITSSTVDFSVFRNTSIIHEGCMGYNIAFDEIIDKIMEYAYTKADNSEENIANMTYVKNQREILQLSSAQSTIYQVISSELDKYLNILASGKCCPFMVDVHYRELIPEYKSKSAIAFSIYMEYSQMIKIISEYMECLRKALMNGMRQLQSYDILPKRIFLVGYAIKYKIISNMIKDEFPEQIVYIPNYLDYVISDGAALFLYRLDNKIETKG